MSFRLSELLKYEDIVIQCHDNPDADALASGFAVYWYLKKFNKKARFIYGGKFPLQKSNLVLMRDFLEIPAEYVTEIEKPQLLLNVDCQFGESNVTRFDAENYAVIDHHQVSGSLPEVAEVRSSYGSCSTVIYSMFEDEGIDINDDDNLATALYYGLMTDTNSFAEISHPADRDLRDHAKFLKAAVTLFKNSNISKDELWIAGDALKHAFYDDKYKYSIVEAAPCDPNILGLISDMLLEVDTVETCLAYSVLPFGVKISVRSCVKEVKASELAGYLAEGYGGGGGHIIKAGGFLKKDLIVKDEIPYESADIKKLLNDRMQNYFSTSEIIYASPDKMVDITDFDKYVKLDLEVGYADVTELAPLGTTVTVRTLEGDVDITVQENIYIIIGIDGEIYPCKKEKFLKSYNIIDKEYVYLGEYSPVVVNISTGERIELLPHAHSCIATGGTALYAKQIDHRMKLFTTWDQEKYYLGVPGDYQAVREDDYSDTYIIAKDIFKKSYRPAPRKEEL